VSVSNFVATFCQYEALKYVSFPTQTLGKCGKIFPVLILGSLGLGAKKYGKQDYIEGFFVTFGCLVFFLLGSATASVTVAHVTMRARAGSTKAPQAERDDSVYGLLLMAIYLFSDGCVCVW
jgi:adenosine 3'-phospho 5'-phosphosulfate transporter B2